MFKKKILGLSLAATLAVASVITLLPHHVMAEDAKVKVVATIFPQYDFLRAIGGDKIDLKMLLTPGAESHTFEPTPKDIKEINESKLFVYVGGDSDEWVNKILDSVDKDNKKIVTLMDCVSTVPEETVEGMEEEHDHDGDKDHDHDKDHEDKDHVHDKDHEDKDHDHDKDHEDKDHDHDKDHEDKDHDHDKDNEDKKHEDNDKKEEHEKDGDECEVEYDEHVWTSPANAKLIVEKLTKALVEVDSKNADYYEKNEKEYLAKLDKLDKDFKEVVDNGKRKEIIVGDRFPYRYLVDAYGLKYYAAFPGCSADTEANPKTIAFLTNKVKEDKIPVVFHEELSNKKVCDAICQATGAKPLLLNAIHNVTKEDFEKGKTYLQFQEENVKALKEALN